jgi:hypothetical protein
MLIIEVRERGVFICVYIAKQKLNIGTNERVLGPTLATMVQLAGATA